MPERSGIDQEARILGVSYQLKPRDVERRLFAFEQLLERPKWKGLLHRIVTGGHDKVSCRYF